ncbi:hypothetical protein KUV51_21205 [Tateyamaria omphalii]|uniref:hypothetical protein n=1 Tax=Tateyamaria omphalii TaxID=299262 RepID=UPI001C99EA13|nr:hypothetical protein [Tateyamaria omphalii]MBY5935540.1 hypothetical protein [Tateyamaria omphalii]
MTKPHLDDGHPDIFVTDDRMMVLTGGDHSVLDYCQGRAAPGPDDIARFFKAIDQRTAWATRRGIPYGYWVFPDKVIALGPKLARLGPVASLFETHYRGAPAWKDNLPVHYPLDLVADQGDAFPRTDTHYSNRGLVTLTSAILDSLTPGQGAAFRTAADSARWGEKKLAGDLGVKFEPPVRERVEVLRLPIEASVLNNGLSRNNGVMSLVECPQAQTDKTLLIFGDSFFRQMLPLLAWQFRRIVFCRTQFFHYELVEAVAPDVILQGTAERYLAGYAGDAGRPHFLSYPFIRDNPMTPHKGFGARFAAWFDQSKLTMGVPDP